MTAQPQQHRGVGEVPKRTQTREKREARSGTTDDITHYSQRDRSDIITLGCTPSLAEVGFEAVRDHEDGLDATLGCQRQVRHFDNKLCICEGATLACYLN